MCFSGSFGDLRKQTYSWGRKSTYSENRHILQIQKPCMCANTYRATDLEANNLSPGSKPLLGTHQCLKNLQEAQNSCSTQTGESSSQFPWERFRVFHECTKGGRLPQTVSALLISCTLAPRASFARALFCGLLALLCVLFLLQGQGACLVYLGVLVRGGKLCYVAGKRLLKGAVLQRVCA